MKFISQWFSREAKLRAALASAQEAGRIGLALYNENEKLREEVEFLKRSSEGRMEKYMDVYDVSLIQDDLKREKEKTAVLLKTIEKMEKGHKDLMKNFTPEEE
jgi:hypothetical protein